MDDRQTARAPEGRAVNRVLLMSLPAVVQVGDDYLSDGHSFHLGIAYVAAALREHGFTVGILDCYAEDCTNVRFTTSEGYQEIGLSDEGILERVSDFSPELVGLSIPFSCQHYAALGLTRQIRERLPNALIVVGGNHVTALPEKINNQNVDYLIIGEGERVLLELLGALRRGETGESVPGVIGKDPSAYRPAGHIEDPDELPFPAIDLLPLPKLWANGRRWINMVATRGCVFDCSFCSIHTVMGRRIRRRSIENVLEEIIHWKKLYKIQEVYFEDDNLTANRVWAKELFRQITLRNLGIRFYARNGIRADTVDAEMLRLMKSAGFHDFMISPESGSQSTLDDVIGKNMTLEDCTRAVHLAREVGIGVNAFFMLGFPEETWGDLENTVRYAKSLRDLGCAGFWFSLATPFPGTRFFRECLRQGFISEDLDFRKLRTVDYVVRHPRYSAEDLKAFRNRAMTDLKPARRSMSERTFRGLRLLFTDPSFFLMKLRYKLGV